MRNFLVVLFVASMSCFQSLPAEEASIDLFAAMDAGDVEVRFIPANAAKANVLIRNATDRELLIELPDAIAAVPVLAQIGGPGAGGGGGGAGAGGGGNQNVGGGLNAGGMNAGGLNAGGGGGGGGGLGNGMGFMRIAPEKTRKLTATTVCLEFGKPEPNPRIEYRMVPITACTDRAQVIELCRQLGQHQIDQQSAQAVAWHLANDKSWDSLADFNRIESKYIGNIKYFEPEDIQNAKEFVESSARVDSVSEATASKSEMQLSLLDQHSQTN